MVAQQEDMYLSEYYFTTAADTETYSVPTPFYKLRGVDIREGSGSGDWCEVRRYAWNERNVSDLDNINDSVMYRLQGNNIRLTPTPDGGRSVRVSYIPACTLLTGSNDSFDGVNGFEEYVVVDAAIKCVIKDEGDASALMAQKMALEKRVQRMSADRDSNEPASTVMRSELWDIGLRPFYRRRPF